MSIRLLVTIAIAALLMTNGTSTLVPSGPEYGVQTVAETTQQTLSEEEAIEKALAHGGFRREDITGLRLELDLEKTGSHWDVDFRSGDWEYDYEINRSTGTVIKADKEYDPVKPAQPAKPETTTPPATEPAQPKELTAEEAKVIALAHAGLKAEEVQGLRAEADLDHGVPEWDVDFRSGDWEYDYEINRSTGAVIKADKEYEPVKTQKPAKPAETTPPATEPAQPKELTAEEVKAIALAHAGLKSSEVRGLRAEYDLDHGVPEWDVEFRVGAMEYEYEIHGQSGKIISWEKDLDD